VRSVTGSVLQSGGIALVFRVGGLHLAEIWVCATSASLSLDDACSRGPLFGLIVLDSEDDPCHWPPFARRAPPADVAWLVTADFSL
jgi:hypothetical protein